MQPTKDMMSGLPAGKRLRLIVRHAMRMTVVHMFVLAAGLSLTLVSSTLAAPSTPHQNSMSQAGVFMQPKANPAQGQSMVAMASAGALPQDMENQRKRRLRELRRALNELESRPASSIDECNDWDNMNAEYNHLASANRRLRVGEEAKEKECLDLQAAIHAANVRMDEFKAMLAAENGQVVFVGELLGNYMDLKRTMGDNPHLAAAYDQLVRDPEMHDEVEDLEEFIEFARDQLLPKNEEVAAEAPAGLDKLEQDIRQLVDKENELSEDEPEKLNHLANELDQALNVNQEVGIGSGRFQYLSGTLDAARAVLLRKLNEEEKEEEEEEEKEKEAQVEAQAAVATAQPGHGATAAARSAGPGSAIGANAFAAHQPFGRGVFTYAQSGHMPHPTTQAANANQPLAPEPAQAEQKPAVAPPQQQHVPRTGTMAFASTQNGNGPIRGFRGVADLVARGSNKLAAKFNVQ